MNVWTILCPGPSLKDALLPHDLGTVIAVNGAVLKECSRVHYWAWQDPEVFGQLNSFTVWQPETTVLLTGYNIESASKAAGWDFHTKKAYEAYGVILHQHLEKIMAARGRDFAGIDWREFTFLTAMAWAILNRPSHINIFGADLSGEGYFTATGVNWKQNHSDKRWAREKDAAMRVLELCLLRGISVRIYNSTIKLPQGEGGPNVLV